MFIKDAPTIWEGLRSIICVYKPANTTVGRVRENVLRAVCNGLNEMEVRPPSSIVKIEGNTSMNYVVKVEENFADHPLVVGPRYQVEDLRCSWSNYLGFNTSGVLILGLRFGTKVAKQIRENYPTRCYRLGGRLGEATDNGFKDGKVVEKSTWKHIKAMHMERFLSAMQASHQKEMFKSSGLDLQTQAAYDIAVQGPIRPDNSKLPVLYGIKCVKFDPPDFELEIQCVNEYETYLKSLIHEIGLKLHSTAHCTKIQCIRHCYFTLDNALLQKHWTLQHIITNMEDCMNIIKENQQILNQQSVMLR